MYHARRILSRLAALVVSLIALLALIVAAWFAVTLARADAEFRLGTPQSVARAIQLAPRNTAYLSQQALQIEYEGGDPRPLLEEIALINPASSAPRIRLGLDAEVRGDLPGAERWLLDAARVDHQYEPRWTLANFYFRQQRPGQQSPSQQSLDEFWRWIRSALEVSYGDRTPAFDLCERADQDSQAIDTQAILTRAIPDQHAVLAAFLWYLNAHKPNDAALAAERLAPYRDPSDLPTLYATLDNLVKSGDRQAAREIWRNLGYPEPTTPVFNPDFGTPRIGHGFDWQMIQQPGVTYVSLDAPSLRVSFNGMQPESCELVRQYVGVRVGKRHILRWESRGIASGLTWRIGGGSATLRAGPDWTPGQLVFTASQNTLTLNYNRPLGEPRVEGSVELRHVTIEDAE
jgi:hypothetical protein